MEQPQRHRCFYICRSPERRSVCDRLPARGTRNGAWRLRTSVYDHKTPVVVHIQVQKPLHSMGHILQSQSCCCRVPFTFHLITRNSRPITARSLSAQLPTGYIQSRLGVSRLVFLANPTSTPRKGNIDTLIHKHTIRNACTHPPNAVRTRFITHHQPRSASSPNLSLIFSSSRPPSGFQLHMSIAPP